MLTRPGPKGAPPPSHKPQEGRQAVKMTRLSCHRFRSHEVRRWRSVIAYNPANLWRRVVLRLRLGKWSLTSLQQRKNDVMMWNDVELDTWEGLVYIPPLGQCK
jgi:hypothetical protein